MPTRLDTPDSLTGLIGDFGRLAPGEWTYRSVETHTFTGVPEPASAAPLAAAALLLRRRRGNPPR